MRLPLQLRSTRRSRELVRCSLSSVFSLIRGAAEHDADARAADAREEKKTRFIVAFIGVCASADLLETFRTSMGPEVFLSVSVREPVACVTGSVLSAADACSGSESAHREFTYSK